MEHPPEKRKSGEVSGAGEDRSKVKRKETWTCERGVVADEAQLLAVRDNGPQEIVALVEELLRKARRAARGVRKPPPVKAWIRFVKANGMRCKDDGEGNRRQGTLRVTQDRRHEKRTCLLGNGGSLVEIPTKGVVEQVDYKLAGDGIDIGLCGRFNKAGPEPLGAVEYKGPNRRGVVPFVELRGKLRVEFAAHEVFKNLRNEEQSFVVYRFREYRIKYARHGHSWFIRLDKR